MNATQADLSTRLLFAIPKKGRLFERTMKLLEACDLKFNRKTRSDIALCTNLPVALIFLPALDIPKYVGEGNVDLGITGQDVIAESEVVVEQLLLLGFGKCRLCLQAPIVRQKKTAAELAGARIVTSFPVIANAYFKKLSSKTSTHVQSVSGSVEAACGLGLADAIVDLVETGETMREAGLEIVDEIMVSEATLLCNPKTKYRDLIRIIQKRIAGVLAAEKYSYFKYNVCKDNLAACEKITPGNNSPTISSLERSNWVAVSAMISTEQAQTVMDRLEDAGATDILIFDLRNCRV